MAAIYFFIYNNYYNRQFKKEDSINDYGAIFYQESNNLNFNPNDGITTTYTAGRQNNPYNGMCDYAIYSEDGTHITSRWFIMEQERTLKGQYKCTLRRDVVVDNWDKIQNAPMFIEKATLNQDSPLIYNKENMSFNQIKTSEEQLKDETGCAWIVGYLDRKYTGGAITTPAPIVPDWISSSFDAFPDADYYDDEVWYNLKETYFEIPFKIMYNTVAVWEGSAVVKQNGITFRLATVQSTLEPRYSIYTGAINELNIAQIQQNIKDALANYYTTAIQYINPYITDITRYNTLAYSSISGNKGKVVKIVSDTASDTYYMLGAYESQEQERYSVTSDKVASQYLRTYTDNLFTGVGFSIQSQTNLSTVICRDVDAIFGTKTENQFGDFSITMPSKDNRLHLKDAPYDMFIMPYGERTILVNNALSEPVTYGIMSNTQSIAVAQGIAAELGKSIYDIQILPYCPATGFKITKITAAGERLYKIDINNTDEKRYTEISLGAKKVGAMIWCTASSGSKSINKSISVLDKKISNETEMYRLCSGNYSSVFEFSAAKNNGVSGFNVDFTYIPYSPYIHVAPIFAGLYGGNFQDPRGLIDQGDHSISYISDTWTSFINNNKNYLNAFNRQIDNLEINHKYQMLESGISSVIGAAGTGATVGIATGSIAGGIVAGAASLGGGIADQFISQAKYNEAIDFTKDNFAFQLDNIQAQPNTLAKVVALTVNNKIFPIIEKYTATDEEVKALCNKIRYNGMTVGVIGKVSDYIGNSWTYNGISDKGYIKGQIIQLDIFDDYHSAIEIANELNKGVYTK